MNKETISRNVTKKTAYEVQSCLREAITFMPEHYTVGRGLVAVGDRQIEVHDTSIGSPQEWELQVRVQRSAISVGTESYVIRTLASAEKPPIIGYSPVACVEAAGQQAAQYFLKGDRVVYFVADRSEEGRPHVNGGHQSPALLSVNPQYRDLLGPD